MLCISSTNKEQRIMKPKARVIAFFLPQYHPTPENDEWWGKGFTEWTNVGKAKPLFRGHKQPKIPSELGYYDLRLPETREAQAELARESGIEGFCYYHYWFGNGREMLDRPFKEVVQSGQPDFPFCLCWANESWHKKFWNPDGVSSKKTLVEQNYDDEEGNKKHFYQLLPAFKDRRYIKVNNRLLFAIYKPLNFEYVSQFMHQWNELAKKEGLGGFYFIGQTYDTPDIDLILSKGFDAVNIIHLWDCFPKYNWILKRVIGVYRKIFKTPRIIEYKKVIKYLVTKREEDINIIPTIIPNWDHTPRSGWSGTVIKNCYPSLFSRHVKDVLKVINKKPDDEKLVFLKSWNEWGEGNYMEPDIENGRSYIEELRKVLFE